MPAAFSRASSALSSVGLQLGVFDIAACAGTVRFHGGFEIIVRFLGALLAQGEDSEALFGFGNLFLGGQQLLVFGGRLRAGQEVCARQGDIGGGDLPLRKIGFGHGTAGQRGGLEIAGGEVLPGRGFHLRGRLAEGVAVGGIFGDAVTQVVEQHADLAEVIGVGHHKVDARPIEIGFGGRLARR